MAIKERMKSLFTGGLQVGVLGTGGASPGTFVKHIVAGSLTVNVGSVGAVGGSTVCEVGTIAGLTASHVILAQEVQATQNACLALMAAKAGAGQASFVWAYTGGSGLGVAASHAATIGFIAAQT